MMKQEKELSIKAIEKIIVTVSRFQIRRSVLKVIERLLDIEFKRMDVKPFVYHFSAVSPFNAITIASFRSSWKEVSSLIHEASRSVSSHNRATSLLRNLANDYYIYGIAICDRRDTFNRQRGRIIAKGRLLKHLKEIAE